MCKVNNKNGFTLIELMVVIVILGIISAIMIPRLVGVIERARITADQATVRTLNTATNMFRLITSSSDPFEDKTKNNQDLLDVLIEGGYLAAFVEPQTKGAMFEWLFEKEKWYLLFEDSFYVVSLEDGLTMEISGGQLGYLKGSYSGSSKDIIIPNMLKGTLIKNIWQDTFREKGLVAVAFGEGSEIKQIHARAFYGNNLSSIVFPDTVERIDLWSFRNNNLTEIKLPPNLHTIEQHAFNGNNLNKITIGSNVTIGNKAFGEETVQFKDIYETGGAGTYLFTAGEWVKQ